MKRAGGVLRCIPIGACPKFVCRVVLPFFKCLESGVRVRYTAPDAKSLRCWFAQPPPEYASGTLTCCVLCIFKRRGAWMWKTEGGGARGARRPWCLVLSLD